VVDRGREDGIAVVDDESTGRVQRETIPELLDGPFSRWVRGDVPVKDSPRRDVENAKTYSRWNVAVTTTKKSHASTVSA
jgi:hypothetical protein